MIEAEWLACSDPDQLFDHLEMAGVLSQRKLRLFAVACCHEVVHLCPKPDVFRMALETAELFADGLRPEQELMDADGVLVMIERRLEEEERDDPDTSNTAQAAYHAMQAVGQAMCLDTAECPYRHRMRDVALHVANASAFESVAGPGNEVGEREGWWERSERAERITLAILTRDIIDNPFRPVEFDPAWRTTDVKLLARGIYEDRAFDRMPILADALQDAGCDSDDILSHCRDVNATHVRGCWALDLVLGKE